MRVAAAAAALCLLGPQPVSTKHVGFREDASARQAAVAEGAAYFMRSLNNPRDRRESRAEVLDTPVHAGSVVKPIALVAALERGVIRPDSAHMCRRTATAGGQTLVCAHPDLKRPLTPAEALAYSCNDFFVSLAPRLSREALNATRMAAGLPPIGASTPMAAAIVGLAGPRTSPRALIDVMARLVGAGGDKPVPMRPETREVLLEGLRGAADYGTASALKAAGVPALAKTGSILMPNGSALGLVVALTPADQPSRAVIVAAPGGAGADAAAIAAQLLNTAAVETIRLGRAVTPSRTRIETLAIDDYVAQVLAGEGEANASDSAHQALAITARTFALANRNRHRAEGFDLCDTTHCQVVRPATPATTRAAQATSGRLLLHQGQPAFVFYSAWCGGQTELASQVWPGAIDYAGEPSSPLDAKSASRGPRPLEDEACEDEPEWTSEVRAVDIENALRTAGLRGSRLRGLRVLARNASDRVSRIRVEGFTPPEMSGHEFRMAVGRVAGWQSIKSTAFEVDRTGTGYRFTGRGFGHGVGLCVIGAGRRAARGATADEILRFYFPGLTIGAVSASARPTTSELRRDGRLELALPAVEEGERAVVAGIVHKAADEIAKQTGAKIPPLRVTVHPTVESFGRATGQSWWVSGATSGSAIDLLPITILRQQGQLERTIRHEVAHAMLDGALAKRPMWVREGAAIYFSSPAARTEAPGTVVCPGDLEILRPVSAGAQRDAYERAAACFARGMAAGRRWDQLK